mmetsp:Transcript_7131/g.10621  ORF Transcript_7131/g.10621 Transcript_7131/m.10621 type:complete len:160 (-) Transcript_7131:71-550(-)
MELNKTTLLRIYEAPNLSMVDDVLCELERDRIVETPLQKHTTSACTQTEYSASSSSTEDDNDDFEWDESRVERDDITADDKEPKLKFVCSMQYHSEGELAAIVGQVWVGEAEASVELPEDRVDVSEPPPDSSTESIETEQLRRLLDIAAWRRSILQNIK